jgi:fructokinase
MTAPGVERSGPDRIGVDLGGTKIEAVRLAPDGHERWRQRVPTPAGDYTATVQAVAALVQAARAAQADGATPTVGVGSPGTAGAGGLMKGCNSTCLNGQRLQADLQAAIGQPVALANDANCLALSEATDGAGAGAGVVFAVILGTGVGAGIAVHGRVLAGPNGLAGEWGHNPLPWAEAEITPGTGDPVLRCWCGQRGCIETLLSGPALAHDHVRAGGQGLAAADIAAAAQAGDGACAATLQRHASRLARALAGVVNLLDPDVIVLAGGVSQLPGLVPSITAQWARWVFAGGAGEEPVRTALRLAQHGDASGVRGAAWLGAQAPG